MIVRRPRTPLRLLACLPVLLLAACGGEPDAPGPLVMDQHEYERWEIALVEMRIEKNEAFVEPESSPLPAELIPDFEGLNYYLPVPSLRYRVALVPEAAADTVRLAGTKGGETPYVRRGHVVFRHDGRNHRLAVFGPVGEEGAAAGRLWLPFYDATNGNETYPGGRYLDLEADAEGFIDLDFNYAYNPYCDYDPERWSCTVPPRENTVDFAVVAGEKRFGTDH